MQLDLTPDETVIYDQNLFVLEIERINNETGVGYIDSVVHWCEKNNLDIETAAYWVKRNPTIKSKIQAEAEDINLLKRGAQLPI